MRATMQTCTSIWCFVSIYFRCERPAHRVRSTLAWGLRCAPPCRPVQRVRFTLERWMRLAELHQCYGKHAICSTTQRGDLLLRGSTATANMQSVLRHSEGTSCCVVPRVRQSEPFVVTESLRGKRGRGARLAEHVAGVDEALLQDCDLVGRDVHAQVASVEQHAVSEHRQVGKVGHRSRRLQARHAASAAG